MIGDSRKLKYIMRRLGLLITLVLFVTTAVMWTTVKITVEDMINPPPPQPSNVTRLEYMSGECWDVLAVRHDQQLDALFLTVNQLCTVDANRVLRFWNELRYWLENEYQGEQYFITEWAVKEGRKYVIAGWTVCNGIQAVRDLTTANCEQQPIGAIVPQFVWRRWWIEDYNTDF